jgi:hypothetical protein
LECQVVFLPLGRVATKAKPKAATTSSSPAATFTGLPGGRAYEQASPAGKNGNDAMGDVPTIKATFSGDGITFTSTFGVPGGKGAQEFPTYLSHLVVGQLVHPGPAAAPLRR